MFVPRQVLPIALRSESIGTSVAALENGVIEGFFIVDGTGAWALSEKR